MVVVKEVTWCVDEIETWNAQQTQDRPVTRQERTIATGGRKGRWTGTRTSIGDIWSVDMTIAIPFDITIDSSAESLNDFTSEHSRSLLLLAIKHNLTVNIVMGTETINWETGSLVDRKDAVLVLGAIVPIPVHDYAENSVISEQFKDMDTMLPQYDGCSGSPPSYSELLR